MSDSSNNNGTGPIVGRLVDETEGLFRGPENAQELQLIELLAYPEHSKSDVMRIQTLLTDAGIDAGPIDGDWKGRTSAGVMEFLGDIGVHVNIQNPNYADYLKHLEVTDRPDLPDMYRDGQPYFKHMSADQIRDVQTILKEQGLYQGEIDGIAGKQTFAAASLARDNDPEYAHTLIARELGDGLDAMRTSDRNIVTSALKHLGHIENTPPSNEEYEEALDDYFAENPARMAALPQTVQGEVREAVRPQSSQVFEDRGATRGPTVLIPLEDLSPEDHRLIAAAADRLVLSEPIDARVTSPYMRNRGAVGYDAGGAIGHRDHKGTDYAAPVGTPLYSPVNQHGVAGPVGNDRNGWGRYTNIGYFDDDGKVVFNIRHAHLSSIDVRAGDVVAPGDLIGKTGNTGRSTGPHLHFEIAILDERDGRWKTADPEAIYGQDLMDPNVRHRLIDQHGLGLRARAVPNYSGFGEEIQQAYALNNPPIYDAFAQNGSDVTTTEQQVASTPSLSADPRPS